MAEEQKLQELGGHSLCANNCGFFGSPTTLNLCSNCYKDHCLRERQISDAKMAVEKTLKAVQSESSCSSLPISAVSLGVRDGLTSDVKVMVETVAVAQRMVAVAKPNRCASCRRRVGLIGFKCRCGTTFCGSHRYPEQHNCTFDFMAVGREEIAMANPIAKAKKLQNMI